MVHGPYGRQHGSPQPSICLSNSFHAVGLIKRIVTTDHWRVPRATKHVACGGQEPHTRSTTTFEGIEGPKHGQRAWNDIPDRLASSRSPPIRVNSSKPQAPIGQNRAPIRQNNLGEFGFFLILLKLFIVFRGFILFQYG